MHEHMNVAVGGVWPGYADETTVFPQHMYVDDVRVYQMILDEVTNSAQ